jgi:hypothetical protein
MRSVLQYPAAIVTGTAASALRSVPDFESYRNWTGSVDPHPASCRP